MEFNHGHDQRPRQRSIQGGELPLWAVLVVAFGVLAVGLGGRRSGVDEEVLAAAADAAWDINRHQPRGLVGVPESAMGVGHQPVTLASSNRDERLAAREPVRGDEPVNGSEPAPTEDQKPPSGRSSSSEPGWIVDPPVRPPGPSESGEYREGLRHGEWVTRDRRGVVRERGRYEAGRREGFWELYDASGLIFESSEFADGERNGEWRAFDPTGHLIGEGAHRQNLRSGEWVLRYSDGSLKERGRYQSGLREGLWEFYDDVGLPTRRSGTYRAGIKVD